MSPDPTLYNTAFHANKPPADFFEFIDIAEHFQLEQFPLQRRGCFQIALLRGDGWCYHAGKSLRISGPMLKFFPPDVPFRFEPLHTKRAGYICVFGESFFSKRYTENIRYLPLFAAGAAPGYVLTQRQDGFVSETFRQIKSELHTPYLYKLDLIRCYLTELIHYPMRMKLAECLPGNLAAYK